MNVSLWTRILAEEMAVLDLVDARNNRSVLWVYPWLIQPLSAPAGAVKTTSMRALVTSVHRRYGRTVFLLAPIGKAVDVAVREGANDEGFTIAKALRLVRDNTLQLGG